MEMSARLDEAKYAKVLGKYKPRPVRTEEDNERAIATLERLYENEPLDPEQEALAEILTTLIEKFEDERYALKEATPAPILSQA
jgi:HTH-type transcriptional regulator / antitoxin HigA